MKILSVPKNYCGIQNNFIKNFWKSYKLYGVYISFNFDFRLAFEDTKNIFLYIESLVVWTAKNFGQVFRAI